MWTVVEKSTAFFWVNTTTRCVIALKNAVSNYFVAETCNRLLGFAVCDKISASALNFAVEGQQISFGNVAKVAFRRKF